MKPAEYPCTPPKGIFHFPQSVMCLTKESDTGKESVKIRRISGDEFEFEITPKKLSKTEQMDFPIRICEYEEQTEQEFINKEEPKILIKSEKKIDITLNNKHRQVLKDGDILKIGNTITYTAGTNLITLDDSAGAGDSWGTAYDMDDVLANAGAVVTKQGANAYDVSARMQFNAGVYFVSESEFVELKPNPINPAWTLRGEPGSHIRLGNYDATDKFSYNGAFWRVYVNSTTSAAGNYFKGETLIYGSNFWNDALNYQRAISCEPSGTTKIYNSIIQGISYMRTTDIDMQDVKWMYNAGASHGLMVASGYDYAWSGITTMDASSGAGGFFMSGTTTSAVDMYAVTFLGCVRDVNLSGGCNWLLRLINSPTFSTISTPGSGKPGAKICYTFNVKVVNAAGAGIVGAVVRLKDVDGLTVFEESTVSGGVLPTDEIVTKYWYRHTDDGGNKDFNNHTLRISNGADVVEYVITIDHEIKEDIVLVPTPTASYDDLMAGITDIKGTGFVKDTDSLVDIRPETDKIQTGIIDTPNTYKANVTNLDVAVSTRNATTPPTVGDIKTELEGVGTKLTTVKDQTDKLQFAVGNDIKATLDSEEVTTDTASRTASKATGFATENPPSQNLADYKAEVSNLDTTVSSRSSHSAGDVWTAGSRALSTPNDYKADVSALATTSALSTHDTKLDTVDGLVDRILKATEIKQCIITDASATTLSFTTNLAETSNQFWSRGVILITSGNNEGQIRAILNYNGSTKAVTLKTPLNTAPAQNDTFIILSERKYLTPDIEDIIGAVWDEPIASHTDVLHFGGKNQKVVPSETINDYKATGFATENPPSQNLADYKADIGNLDVAVSTRSSHSDPTSSIKGLDNKDLTQVFDNEKGTDGAYTGTPPTVTDIRTEMDSNSTKMAPSQVLDDYKATGFNTTTPPTVTEIKTKMEEVGSHLDFIKNVESGKWEIVANQMIFYKADNVTEVCRFNLFDAEGNPSMTDVYRRELV